MGLRNSRTQEVKKSRSQEVKDIPTGSRQYAKLKTQNAKLFSDYQKEKSSHGGHGVHGVIERYGALFCFSLNG
jgi:hypothetical protein